MVSIGHGDGMVWRKHGHLVLVIGLELLQNNAWTLCRLRILPMHVGKPSDHWSLTSHMHGCCGFKMPRPAAANVMIHRQNVKNASFVLVHFYKFFSGFWPRDRIARYVETKVSWNYRWRSTQPFGHHRCTTQRDYTV